MRGWLRRLYMRTTSLSNPWAGSRLYVRVFYFFWSRCYDWSVGMDPAYRRNARRMVDAVVKQGDRVLDLGVGTGLLAEYGGERSSEYVGLDYSGAMLSRAAKKLARLRLRQVSLCWGDARQLRYADEEYSTVISSFALPHFARDEKLLVLKEALRVLQPGGRLGLFLAQGEVAPLFSTLPELQALLTQAGFEAIHIEDHDHVYRVITARRPAGVRPENPPEEPA